MSRRIAAWGVHLATGLGAVAALLAVEAITRADWRAAMGWMIAAMAIDSFDGTLARLLEVRRQLPAFDGALLDNIIDYLNYVFVPAFLLLRADLVPARTEWLAASAILLSSGYQFCQDDAKTDDHFFKGFPSFWNVAVLYMLVLGAPPSWNLTVLLVLALAVFVPVHWAYPSRMQKLRGLTLVLTVLWGVSVVAIAWSWPAVPRWLLFGSSLYLAYYAAISLYLSLRRAPAADLAGR